jgi:micrococcal nuclease
MYQYKARLVRVVDGDTVVLDIDLGFETTRRITVRLYGVSTPERFSEEGKLSTLATQAFLTGRDLVIETFKDRREKYGRYVAKIVVNDVSLGDWLVSQSLAKYVDWKW